MEGWLTVSAIYIGLALEAMALVIIGIGSVKVFVAGISTMVFKSSSHDEIRSVWLDYARWLIAGLTFQLAADLVHTTVAPTWDDIGRLAAIAVTRTFLSYFLERDMEDIRGRRMGNLSSLQSTPTSSLTRAPQ
jgi:uncharacterized membrane protein